jgi:hypothetical protein
MNGNSNVNIEDVQSEEHASNGVGPEYPSSQSNSPPQPFHKSISCPGSAHSKGFILASHTIAIKANTLLKTVMRKELTQNDQVEYMPINILILKILSMKISPNTT